MAKPEEMSGEERVIEDRVKELVDQGIREEEARAIARAEADVREDEVIVEDEVNE